MNTIISFERDIVKLNKDNFAEKLLPYMNELIQKLLSNECENIRITTKIKLLSNTEAEVYFTINEMNDLLFKKKK